MYNGKRILAIIPARGGSKGVPGKNIRVVGGKPLIAWTIDAARASCYLDRIILSSEAPEIIQVAQQYHCEVPFVRDISLAHDTTPTMDVVMDALYRCPGYEWVVLLQPTSPLRTAQDIDAAINHCIALNAPACVSVCAVEETPYWMYTLNGESQLKPLLPSSGKTRRQDLPAVYSLNGAIYIAQTDWLLGKREFITAETVAYEMPLERSLDIDTESDLFQLQTLLGDIKYVSLS